MEKELTATNGEGPAEGLSPPDHATDAAPPQGAEADAAAAARPSPDDVPAGRPRGDGATGTGAAGGGGSTATGGSGVDRGGAPARRRSVLDRVTRNWWWRRNLGNNFSLEHELDAKIDRLRIILSTMPQNVVPAMDDALRRELVHQLDRAGGLLADCEPFEQVMQRIIFVEAEIMMRLADERLNLAIEALRAEASISLPESASRTMLDEIDTLAKSTEPADQRKVRIVGLKARLSASVIELFRGSERTRDAIQILGVALIALTCVLGGLFYRDLALRDALFTHYGAAVTLARQQPEPPAAATPAPPPAPVAEQPAVTPDAALGQDAAGDGVVRLQILPDGKSPLLALAFAILLMAACFGGIGACLSGLFSFTLQGRVPNEYEGWFRTLIRPVIGIASGVLAVFILRSGLLTFGDDLAWVAIAALAFGFSERLFMGTMERLEGLPK